MASILICGDPHGRFDHILAAAQEQMPDAIILLGDLTPHRPLDVELAPILDRTGIWWIPGNHDTDTVEWYDATFGSLLGDRCLHGRIVDVAGVRVAGLGGVFRGKIWQPGKSELRFQSPGEYLAHCGKGNHWRGGLPLRHRSSIFPSDLDAFAGQHADVLVCHEGPDLHPCGSAELARLAQRLGVKAAFHGHHHEDLDYEGGVWRQVGFRSIYRWEG